jgi:ATP adenylyltransferase
MDYLFTPWRYAYLSGVRTTEGCLFCELQKRDDDAAYIVHRGEHCFVVLNAFPYTSGHAMVAPYQHLDSFAKLPRDTANEMTALTQRLETALRALYHPDGINLGMNLGQAAGAGVTGHAHMHILPRWAGDANFMTTIGETRMLPESLDETYRRMRQQFS